MSRTPTAVAVLVAALLVGGCASTAENNSAPADVATMSPGMTMPDGSVMGDPGSPGDDAVEDGPSESAAMICNDETHAAIRQVLGLDVAPHSIAKWTKPVYTCTYHLSGGPLTISAKEFDTSAMAQQEFTASQARLATAKPLYGLGEKSYGDPDGLVVLVKDNDMLNVDATQLPATLGAQHNKRYDFAYQIASDILGCWTGDS